MSLQIQMVQKSIVASCANSHFPQHSSYMNICTCIMVCVSTNALNVTSSSAT